MKKILLITFFILLTDAAKAETTTIKFDHLRRLVSSQNGYVLAEEAYVKGAAAQKGHLKRSFLPEVKINGGFETFKTGHLDTLTQPTADALAKINLFRGGKDKLEDKIIGQKYVLAHNSFKKTYLENLLRARMLYADILFYEEQLTYVRGTLFINQNNLQRVQKQIDAGLATETDRLEFSLQANRLKQDKLLFVEDHEHAIEELKTILGLDPQNSLKLVTPNLINIDKLFLEKTRDFKDHPEVAQMHIAGQISNLQKKQQELWWVPNLDTYGLYELHPFRERERTSVSDRDEYVFGVNLSLNIFDGLQSLTKSKALKYQSQGLSQAKQQKSKELQTQFEKLQHELRTRKQLIGLLHQNIGQSQKYAELSSDEYSRGVKTASQLFTASQQLYDEKQKLSETKRDSIKIKSALLVMTGN
jgi:outer membrane protein TolC